MITYVSDLIKLVKAETGNVPVATTYPDTNIVPIVILYESEQTEIFTCSEYERAASTIMIEIYAKDIPTRTNLKNKIDKVMRDLRFELSKKEDTDGEKVYASKLTYVCELIYKNDEVHIYNKKK